MIAEDAPTAETDAPDLQQLRRWYEADADGMVKSRDEAKLNRQYYDGVQINDTDRRALKEMRRLPVEENWVRLAVNGLVGVLERGKTDPEALPRNPDDQDSSAVATKTLRYVADTTRWQRRKQSAAQNFFVEGVAAVIVEVNAKLDVEPRRIRYEEFFADRYSRELDYSDAARMGVAKWMDQAQIVAIYPEKREAIDSYGGMSDSGPDASWNDRPDFGPRSWNDPKRRRMLVVEMYHQDGGTWRKSVFTGGCLLEYGDSPYLDDDGKPCNPIEAVAAYVDDENNRYGAVRDMRGPQDSINKRNIELLAFAVNRQLQEASPGVSGVDAEEARREARRPDGVIPSGWQIVPTGDMSQLQAVLLGKAQEFMQRVSPNPAVLGREGENSSGRNNLVRQQAGLTESADLYGALEDWELRVFRQVWSRIRQYWKAEKFIRVTDDEKSFDFIHLNKPVYQTVEGIAVDPMTGQRTIVPQQVQVGVDNEVARMGVDIIIDSVPDTATLQQEEFGVLVELAKLGALGQNPGPMLLRASSFPNKRQLIEQMEQASQPQAPAPPSPGEQLAMREAEAKIGERESKAAKTAAETHKIQLEVMHGMRPQAQPIDGYLTADAV